MLTAAAPEAGRELLAAGRLCANARYSTVGCQSWYDQREGVQRVTIDPSMAAYGVVSLNYWFYGHQALTGIAGMGNLAGVRQMRHTFNSYKSLASLGLSGMNPSALEDLTYTFSGCKSLATIWADAGWELPAGVSGSQTFRQCASLVGGAGTAWSSSAVAGSYMRIDGGAAAPGYLTAKAGA